MALTEPGTAMERRRNRPASPEDSSFEDEQILQDYITNLLNMQDTAEEEWLTEEDLQRTAEDMGLTDRELQRIEQAADGHRARGQQFLTHKAWDEAVHAFQQAVSLAPFDVEVLHGLAEAHRQRWWENGNAADREAAERYARRTIQLDPNHTATYELIKDLQRTPIRAVERGRPTTKKGVTFMALLFTLVALVLGALFVLLIV